MPLPERPCIRPGLSAAPEDRDGSRYVVCDQLRLSDAEIPVSYAELEILKLFDGGRTLRDIQIEVMRWTGGQHVPMRVFENLVQQLDDALFLDGPRWQQRAGHNVRLPSCIGCYEGDPIELREQMRRLFSARGASGPPGP